MVSRDYNQEASFAYYSKEAANNAKKMWNDAQEVEDRKDAEEHGVSYEDWVGNNCDYAWVDQVEILGENDNVIDAINMARNEPDMSGDDIIKSLLWK